MLLKKCVHVVGYYCNNSHYGVNEENSEHTFHKSHNLRCTQSCKECYERQDVPSDKTVCLLAYSEMVLPVVMLLTFISDSVGW